MKPFLTEDGDRPVTVNEMCLALGMMTVLLKTEDKSGVLENAAMFASAIKTPLDVPKDVYELILQRER